MDEELAAQQQQALPQLQQYLSHIIVNDNDVLSGRGVNIAAHYGNERFRTLITTRADENYCEGYSASEKRAVAEEIVRHIASLDPPGRFLKREGRGQVARGLNGPWEELSRKEAIKKTCQALRDCNRKDRVSYGRGVAAPDDVKAVADEIANSGVDLKDRAKKAAMNVATETSQRLREAMEEVGVPEDAIEEQIRRQNADSTYVVPGFVQISDGSFIPYAQPGANPPMMQQVMVLQSLQKKNRLLPRQVKCLVSIQCIPILLLICLRSIWNIIWLQESLLAMSIQMIVREWQKRKQKLGLWPRRRQMKRMRNQKLMNKRLML